MPNDYENRIKKLEKDLKDLTQEVYRNNFTSNQDFNKFVRFNSRLKVPHYTTLPTTCEVGEICEQGGELNICTTANTWIVAGLQT